MNNKIFSLCLGLSTMATMAIAQNVQTVKGTVVDEFGDPMIGAAIHLSGSRIGTVTDIDGNFQLNLPPSDGKEQKIEISYLGYENLTLAASSTMNVAMKPNDKSLEEVVVVGYGTQKAKNVTGAIETMTPEDIKDLSVTSLGEALSGMMTGLHVSMNGSKPGDAAHLTIRQSSELAKNWGSINAKFSSQDDTPLYIIDDFISSESAFNNLDPSEVESISVLKDAAAAIYGAQGAYGVVLVKTKRGQVSAPKISYSGNVGFTNRIFKPSMMDSYQWGTTWNAYKGATDDANSETKMKDYFQSDELAVMRGLNYKPLDDEWSAALNHKHSVTIDGGTDKATYFAGITYNTQDGNLGRLDYSRWNYRAGASVNISKWLKANMQISGNLSEKKTPRNKYKGSNAGSDSGDYMILLEHLPFMPISQNGYPIIYTGMENTANTGGYGEANYNWDAIQASPDYNQSRGNSFQANGSLDLDFGFIEALKGLHAKVNYSRNISNSENNSIATTTTVYRLIDRGGSANHLYVGDNIDYSYENLYNVTLDNGNEISRSMSHSDSYQVNFILNYARKIGDHDLSGLFSIERSEAWSEDLTGTGVNPLPFTDGQSNSSVADASGDATDAAWGRSESGRMSYIGRFNYSYQDKYLFEALFRSDASTKFAPKNYWGNFPSFSAGWVISQEDWFDKERLHLDFLKIRGSWGLMGRDNINSYVWMTRYNRDLSKGALFGNNSSTTGVNAGMTIEQGGANIDAHWDKTYKINFGIDARMLDSRLGVNMEYYTDFGREIFSTHLGTKYYPTTVGIQAVPENFAELNTYGGEISVNWRDKINKDLSYWVKLSTGYSDNKVIKVAKIANPDRDDLIEGKSKDLGLWGYQCIGMFKSYQQIEEYFEHYKITEYMGKKKDAVHPGMLIYKDVNGKWDAEKRTYGPKDHIVDENDMVKISRRQDNPWGFTLNFGAKWKQLSLSGQFGASWGSYVMTPGSVRKSYTAMTNQFGNIPSFWKDMYVYEDVTDATGAIIARANRDTDIPNFKYADVNSVESTYWAVKGTTASLRNLSVAYEMPRKLVSRVGISSCRFNLTCQNVCSFVSPEWKDAWSSWGGSYGSYPNLRKFTVGMNMSF